MASLISSLLSDVHCQLAGIVEVTENFFMNCRHGFGQPQPTPFGDRIAGKVVLLTGGTAGIGRATAEMLAASGAEVIITGRDLSRAQATARNIQEGAGEKSGKVKGMALDLASVADVKRFCKEMHKLHPEVDIIICNAGLMCPLEHTETQDGMEIQFQTNHLGHFIIATELAAKHLRRNATLKSAKARDLRIVMVSSVTHYYGDINFDDLQAKKSYKPFRSYAQSKLANVMTAVELQDRFRQIQASAPSGPTASAVACHPGLVDTQLARNYFETDYLPRWLQPVGRPILRRLFPYLLLAPEISARMLIWSALAPTEQVAGAFVSDCRIKRKARAADDKVRRQRLWDISCQLACISDPLVAV